MIVNLPGIKDQDRAIQLVGQTGKVLFRPVLSETSAAAVAAAAASSTTTVPGSASSTPDASATTVAPSTDRGHDHRDRLRHDCGGHAGGATTTTLAPEVAAQITPREKDTPGRDGVLPGRGGQTIYELGPAFALGEDAISTPRPACRTASGWSTSSSRTATRASGRGTPGRRSATARRPTARPAAWPSCSTARSSPRRCPRPRFFSDTNVQVSGGGNGFQKGEAKDLARVLKYGSVPVELKPQAAQTVSATLGKDSLHAGLIAGFVGVLLVLLLMILYYRTLPSWSWSGCSWAAACCGRPSRSCRRPRALPHPGRRHRHHRVDRHHGRLLRRVPRATEGRRPLGQVAAGVDAQAFNTRGARSWRPTSCRSSAPASCGT